MKNVNVYRSLKANHYSVEQFLSCAPVPPGNGIWDTAQSTPGVIDTASSCGYRSMRAECAEAYEVQNYGMKSLFFSYISINHTCFVCPLFSDCCSSRVLHVDLSFCHPAKGLLNTRHLLPLLIFHPCTSTPHVAVGSGTLTREASGFTSIGDVRSIPPTGFEKCRHFFLFALVESIRFGGWSCLVSELHDVLQKT